MSSHVPYNLVPRFCRHTHRGHYTTDPLSITCVATRFQCPFCPCPGCSFFLSAKTFACDTLAAVCPWESNPRAQAPGITVACAREFVPSILDPAIAELVIQAEHSAPRFALFCPLWMYSLIFHFLYSCIFIGALREAQLKWDKDHKDRETDSWWALPCFCPLESPTCPPSYYLMGVCFVKKTCGLGLLFCFVGDKR